MNKFKLFLIIAFIFSINHLFSQIKNFSVGGYGQIDYNHEISNDKQHTGKLDIHRIVLLMDYRFSENTNFFAEFEMEHVSEFYVEQAYLQHTINPYIHFRAGLLLIPMGIINEYHEPPTYNGVERPNVDKYIVPSTWREIGAGFSGNIQELDLNYQVYVINGFTSYVKDAAKLGGLNGLRSGRQKGAESTMSSPNLALRMENYTVGGLTMGFSGYFGRTQSDLYEGINKTDQAAKAKADSSTVGVSMLGIDARYNIGRVELRGQYTVSNHSGAEAYNAFTGKDLGKTMFGWYAEAAYRLGAFEKKGVFKPFIRYEHYNLHAKTAGTAVNDAFNIQEIVTGISWHMAYGATLKIDYNYRKNASSSQAKSIINAGVGIMF